MKKLLSAFAALITLTACNNGNEQKAETAATADGKAIVENIMTRTSIRQYTNQAISADTIEILLRAGMAAPTAVNKQPWHFVAITSKDKLKELAATNPNARMLEQAPLTIVVCGDMQKALKAKDNSSGFRTAQRLPRTFSLLPMPSALAPCGQRSIPVTTVQRVPLRS